MGILAAMLIVFGLVATGFSQKARREAPYELTSIPFNIENLSDDQSAEMRRGNEADNSSYLIRSRPIVFQIVVTGNDANEVRATGPIDQPVDVLIYAPGEAAGDRLVDYAWIEKFESGDKIWEMTPENSVHAEGAARNRKAVARLTLKPGRYRLRYVSNAAHAYPDWQDTPPERKRFYGVTVFNMTALPLIEARLKQAGIPSLATSLTAP